MFDLEYILINIRAKSVNNMLTFAILDPDTEERVELELDIESIELKKDPKHTNKIKFDNDGIIVMRYPAINELKLFTENSGNSSKIFEIMISCIEKSFWVKKSTTHQISVQKNWKNGLTVLIRKLSKN